MVFTKYFIAKMGRASRLGERAICYQDTGAPVVFSFLHQMQLLLTIFHPKGSLFRMETK